MIRPMQATDAPDVLALLHVYAGQHTLNGAAADAEVAAATGSRARVRVVNTDQGTAAVWASTPLRVVATVPPLPVVGKPVLAVVVNPLDREEKGLPCTAALYLQMGADRYVRFGLSSGT